VLFLQQQNHSVPQLIISALILLWGLRLSLYIFFRKRGKPEDFRYQQWRSQWGRYFVVRTWAHVFMLQMIFLFVIATPLFLSANQFASVSIYTLVGALIAISGLSIETISDWQMAQFKKQHKNHGKIIQSGLWRYSRHPNYFGEAVFWWGIAVIVYPFTQHLLWLMSPLLITLLVRYVSGVPMLEQKYKDNKEFQAYAARTSCFILWFNKKGA
jgi:steroid 5-alpha reductase family enzyme